MEITGGDSRILCWYWHCRGAISKMANSGRLTDELKLKVMLLFVTLTQRNFCVCFAAWWVPAKQYTDSWGGWCQDRLTDWPTDCQL